MASNFSSPFAAAPRRRWLLGSAAAIGLFAAGAAVVIPVHPAGAAAVVTSDLRGDALPSFATVVERVKPAVVSVKVVMRAETSAEAGPPGVEALPPQIQEFLRRFGGQPQGGGPKQGGAPSMAQGSGFFVSGDGYVVTNNHVVEHASKVSVTTDAGVTLDAKVVGTDPKTDLAVLKVAQAGDYPFVAFAKEPPRLGDWVVAIGNPYGLGGTVTAGIVSANGRDIGAGPYDNFLQIDAPINKGNSGGPTFNLKGEVVGVNTAIFSPSGGNIGLAFAIPASTAEGVVAALSHDGQVARGFMGVSIQPVSQEIAEGLGLSTAQGALISEAQPGSPAAKAGLKSGDVIVSLNGAKVADARALSRQVGALKPGDTVTLGYVRQGREQTAQVKLEAQATQQAAQAEPAKDDTDVPMLGAQLAPASQVRGAGGEGVVIVDLDPEGAAAARGLADGDVILEVGGQKVSAPGEVRAGFDAARKEGRRAVLMKVKTADGQRFVAIAVPKA
jgi:serine protease Do